MTDVDCSWNILLYDIYDHKIKIYCQMILNIFLKKMDIMVYKFVHRDSMKHFDALNWKTHIKICMKISLKEVLTWLIKLKQICLNFMVL